VKREDSPQSHKGHRDRHKVRKRSTTEIAEITEREREEIVRSERD
jgi:hypothetical protein